MSEVAVLVSQETLIQTVDPLAEGFSSGKFNLFDCNAYGKPTANSDVDSLVTKLPENSLMANEVFNR
jgi:hypothetical protein